MSEARNPHGDCPVLLFVFANDDRPGRRLDGLRIELERIRRVLTNAEHRGLCEIVVRESTTPEELIDVLEDPRYRNRLTLIHFAGHANDSRLFLEGDGEPVATHIGGLAPLLAALPNLVLVFLNGCATLSQAERLVHRGIPATIAMECSIEDDRARRFAVDFYRTLAAGESISTAFERSFHQADCFEIPVGTTRDLAPVPRAEPPPAPWRLLTLDSTEDVTEWSLPQAANDPLFGLPEPANPALPQQPFMGLRRFTAEDSAVFFGRGRAIRSLYLDVTSPSIPPLVVVYGASGVGKSSLLEAGLLPRLAVEYEVHALRIERNQDPIELLQDSLGSAMGPFDLARSWCEHERRRGRPVLICIDQFETLLLSDDGGEALTRFVRAIEGMMSAPERPRGTLILSLRKEWFPELRNALRARELPWHEHFVAALEHHDIQEVVLGPTRTAALRSRYGILCEPGLAHRVADELLRDRESTIAPVLQILLTRMWARVELQRTSEDGRMQRPFTRAIYDELRREGLALGDFIDQQFLALAQTHAEEIASGLVLDLLFRHTTPQGSAAARHYPELQGLYAHCRSNVRDLIEHCISLYLLLPFEDRDGVRGVRLAHDTLAPIIRSRYQESKAPGQAAALLLQARIGMSEDSGRSRLLAEHDLERVEAGHTGMRDWTEEEHEIVVESRRWRRRTAVLHRARQIVSVLAVGVMAAFWVRRSLDSSTVAIQSKAWNSAEPPAHQTGDSSNSHGDQTSVPARSVCLVYPIQTGSTAPIETVAASPDGHRVAVSNEGPHKVHLLDSRDPSALKTLSTDDTINHLVWSPSGKTLAIGQEKGYLALAHWTGDTANDATPLTGHDTAISALAFSTDGRTLLSADRSGHAITWHVATATMKGETRWGGQVYDARPMPRSTWLLGGQGGRVGIWDGDTSSAPSFLPSSRTSPVRVIESVASGKNVLAAGRRLQTWMLAGKTSLSDDRLDHTVYWMHTIEHERYVVTASKQHIDLWDWSGGALAHMDQRPHENIADVAFLPDSGDAFVSDAEGSVTWLTREGRRLVEHRSFDVTKGPLGPIVVDPELRYFVVGNMAGAIFLVELPGSRDEALGCVIDHAGA